MQRTCNESANERVIQWLGPARQPTSAQPRLLIRTLPFSLLSIAFTAQSFAQNVRDISEPTNAAAVAVYNLSTDSAIRERLTKIFDAAGKAGWITDCEVASWTGSKPANVRRSRDEVKAAIKRALDDAGIEIPFPYRMLTFNDSNIVERFASLARKLEPTAESKEPS
ncbi:MAG: hypothetical protein AB8B50_20370 [Pirellulaceae bacterium]